MLKYLKLRKYKKYYQIRLHLITIKRLKILKMLQFQKLYS